MHRRMATQILALWLLLVGTSLLQGRCQHWSYGLSPGGKRELLDGISDTSGNIVEGIQTLDLPCRVWGCAEDESPLAKIYRMKGFVAGFTDRENGHRSYT